MIYKGKLAQSGESAPSADVLENTLTCNVNWSRVGNGEYFAAFNPAFDESAKVFCHTPVRDNAGDVTTGTAAVFTMDGNHVGVMICGYGTPEEGSLQRRDLEGSMFVCFEVFE